VVVARELTKMHEELLRGTAAQIRATLMARESVKGEITLLIGKRTGAAEDDTPLAEAVEALMAQGMGRMEAIKTVAHRRGLSKRDVYGEMERVKGR
jgi:16S rRNA (cytidine1402-2'-O)-methyltransferase